MGEKALGRRPASDAGALIPMRSRSLKRSWHRTMPRHLQRSRPLMRSKRPIRAEVCSPMGAGAGASRSSGNRIRRARHDRFVLLLRCAARERVLRGADHALVVTARAEELDTPDALFSTHAGGRVTLVCPFHQRWFERSGWDSVFRRGLPGWLPPQSVDPRRRTQFHSRFRVALLGLPPELPLSSA